MEYLRIFASPSWDNESEEGQPHIDFISFMQKSTGKNFNGKSCATFGLGDSTYAHFCGAVDIVTDYIKKNGGKIINDPLKIDGYLFNTEANNKLLSDWANMLKV
ncbi:MAG: Flavodoxin [Candidatus Roizmanbacteria bacterium GW2011_GWA2_35_8]|uniref:Flavodoxin n=1 Tax=Candidatus Roizmanbacteria bacterium GW2011_GWA2_35_8 TaxID=1618479 RepID=A0A0G0FHT0_9BACT|nr:MAG: Flavodoxin [Candidatus Roizmanbacteria bacterium GW2011_GWA2_35_8]